MMSKAWYKGPLRYLLMRAQLGWEETVAHLSGASVSDAIAKGYSVFQRDLTRTIFFTGEATSAEWASASVYMVHREHHATLRRL